MLSVVLIVLYPFQIPLYAKKEKFLLTESLNNTNKYLHAWDASLECPGIAIFDMESLLPIYVNHFKLNSKSIFPYGPRLFEISSSIAMPLIKKYPPYKVAIEYAFKKYEKEFQALVRVHGVINACYKNYKQIYYHPKKIKSTLYHGDATKEQLKEILEKYFNIKFNKNDIGHDESDACAVGLCHLILEENYKWNKPEWIKPEKSAKK